MARAPSADSADARILDLAAEHIRRHGIERTTVVAIAREAAMSHGNVYRYFPSKEALVDAVTGEPVRDRRLRLGELRLLAGGRRLGSGHGLRRRHHLADLGAVFDLSEQPFKFVGLSRSP